MNKKKEAKLKEWVYNLSEEKLKSLCFDLLYDNIICENGYTCYEDDEEGFIVAEEHSGERL